MEKLNKFYVCNRCGQTYRRKRKPRKCKECNDKILGEIQIKWT